MNKIKVQVRNENGATMFYNARNQRMAYITKDENHIGRYIGRHGCLSQCDNKTYPEAVEFITDSIEKLCAELGIEVEFCELKKKSRGEQIEEAAQEYVKTQGFVSDEFEDSLNLTAFITGAKWADEHRNG